MRDLTMEEFEQTTSVQALRNTLKLIKEYQEEGVGDISITIIPHIEEHSKKVFSFEEIASFYDEFARKWMYELKINVNGKYYSVKDSSFRNVLTIAKDIINK